jgi:hypothetical protein
LNQHPHSHLDTPKKARIRQQYDDFKEDNSHSPSSGDKTLIQKIRVIGASKTSYYRCLRDKHPGDNNRTIHNQSDVLEPRGRPRKITPAQINIIERIVEEADIQERAITWECLGYKAGVEDVS